MDNIKNSHQDHHDCHANHTPNEQLSTTHSVDHTPRDHDADNTTCRNPNAKIESVIQWNASEFEEVSREAESEDNS